jgi:hypothetical protein
MKLLSHGIDTLHYHISASPGLVARVVDRVERGLASGDSRLS